MIRITKGKDHPNPLIFQDMPLAHQWCHGRGIELGAGAANPYNLPGAVNVAPWDDDPNSPDYESYVRNRDYQVEFCGLYAEIDLKGEADRIPVPDKSQDFVLSSHVIEHVPDTISAFLEWDRVLKPGGSIFMIFPKRDAYHLDVGRPLTTLEEFIDDYRRKLTAETHPIPEGHVHRGHYHVYSLQSMLDLISWCNAELGLGWEVVATEETDSKVGNGHTVVARTAVRAPLEETRWRRDGGLKSLLRRLFGSARRRMASRR